MADFMYGYRSGPRIPQAVLLDSSTSTISVGDALKLGTAGYYQQAAAGEECQCIAMEAATAPTSDGDKTILADFSTLSIYEYPPDTGTVVVGDVGKQMDLGGPQSINRDASATGDGSNGNFYCVKVDTDAQTLFVQLRKPTFAGA